jgi:dTDP-4-amino-4,6-dideoxygalactose transaminase
MDEITQIAKKHSLVVIEDCAHAVETTWRGQPVGTIGDFGCFSFYATKNITTAEGGMILSKSTTAHEQVKVLALHGMSRDAWKRFSDAGYKHYDVVEAGFKNNMTDIQASIGLHQLRKIELMWAHRRRLWDRYLQELADLPLQLPTKEEQHVRHGLHLFTVLVDPVRTGGITRDGFLEAMGREKLGVGVHYRSLAGFSFYQREYGWRSEDFPNAARIGDQTVSLPFSSKMTNDDQTRVIRTIRKILAS